MLPIGFDPATARTQSPQACANCRSRKVKCIWDGGGCERCKASGRECIYEASAGRRSKQDSAGTCPGAKRRKSNVETAQPPQSPSPPGTSGQSARQPTRPSVTAAEKDMVRSGASSPSLELDLLSMFSTSAPSTAESNFITRNVDMDMDLDAGTGTLFGPSEDMTLNISAGLGAEDGVALGDLVMEPWQIGPWVSEASTNISMSTPTSGYAPKSGHERHVSDGSQCQCLRRIVILVDEIVSIVDRDGLQSLDSALAAQKEALGCGARMLECLDCTRRVENMIILALMVDKLVRMCTHVSEACCAGLRAIGGKSSTDKHKIVGMAPLLSLQCHTNTNRQGPAHQELDRGANPTTRVYSVDSSDEYFFVMAGILRFQLLELSNLSRQLGRAAAPLASDTISQRLAACNEVVDDMLNKAGLASSEASKGEDVEAIQTA